MAADTDIVKKVLRDNIREMEHDILYKLTSGESLLVNQAISKLLLISQKNGEKPQDSVLLEIWKLCNSDHLSTRSSCCHLLITLVKMGLLDGGSTLHKFLGVIQTGQHISSCIMAVGEILLYDFTTNSSDEFKNVFGLAPPIHPFIIVLRQKPESWPLVLQHVQRIFTQTNDSKSYSHIPEFLRPILQFVFGDPTKPPATASLRLSLFSTLIRQLNKADDFPGNLSVQKLHKNLLNLVVDILIWQQHSNPTSLVELSIFYDEFFTYLIVKNRELLPNFTPLLASLALRLHKESLDVVPCLQLLSAIIDINCQGSELILVLLCRLMSRGDPGLSSHILTIYNKILSTVGCSQFVFNMLKFSLLQMISTSSTVDSQLTSTAKNLLTLYDPSGSHYSPEGIEIQKKLRKPPPPSLLFAKILNCCSLIRYANEVVRLVSAFSVSTRNIVEWLDHLKLQPTDVVIRVSFLLCTVLLNDGDSTEEVKLRSLDLLRRVCQENPKFAPQLLVLYLHKLSNESSPDIRLKLIWELPELAVNVACIPTVLQFIQSLLHHQTTAPLGLVLLCSLWEKQDRCYPSLQQALSSTVKKGTEMSVAHAEVIRRICIHRPTQYGEEMVGLLSQVINSSRDEASAVQAALALEGISVLCRNEVIDIRTTWQVLEPRLVKERRVLVQTKTCELQRLAPLLRVSTPTYDGFLLDCIRHLWKLATTSKERDVVHAAYVSLSEFKHDIHTLKMLPSSCSEGITLPPHLARTPMDAARKPEDVLDYVPGHGWMNLLKEVEEQNLSSFNLFLSHLVRNEVLTLGRGIYTVTADKSRVKGADPPTYSYLPHTSILRGIVHFLKNTTKESLSLNHVSCCLAALSHDFGKELPPLDWSFLSLFLEIPDQESIHRSCITLLAKESLKSQSARSLLEETFRSFSTSGTCQSVQLLFSVLDKIVPVLPPQLLLNFVDDILSQAVNTLENTNNDELEHAQILIRGVKQMLVKENLPVAAKVSIGQVVEKLLEMSVCKGSELTTSLVLCSCELPQKNIERLTSPSLWWEVTDNKLLVSVLVRAELAQQAKEASPLVWLNDCIEATALLDWDHKPLFSAVLNASQTCSGLETSQQWFMELLGQMQLILVDRSRIPATSAGQKQQALSFLLEVACFAAAVFSGIIAINQSHDHILKSREHRLSLLPLALSRLADKDTWSKSVPQIFDWLLAVKKVVDVPYSSTLNQCLLMLHHNKHFVKTGIWTDAVMLQC